MKAFALAPIIDRMVAMALKLDIPYTNIIASPKNPSDTYAFFANLETAVGKNFPGLENFSPVGKDQYEWRFQKFEHSGYGFQVAFITQFIKEPDISIRMLPVEKPGMSKLSGNWRFEPQGTLTKVHFTASLSLELPLPFFLKSIAGPTAQKEIAKLFDHYVTHVTQAISK